MHPPADYAENTYEAIRALVLDGDAFLVKRRGFVSGLIRALTGESYSHVALAVWMDDALMIAEMREFRGFQITLASRWITEQDGQVVWGQAPVRGSQCIRRDVALTKRLKPSYGYFGLVRIWWSQIRNKRGKGHARQCSTWVQAIWEGQGYDRFTRSADPGDIAEHCRYLTPIR